MRRVLLIYFKQKWKTMKRFLLQVLLGLIIAIILGVLDHHFVYRENRQITTTPGTAISTQRL